MKRAYCVVCLFIVLAAGASAQSTIEGVVKDTSDAASAGARVEASRDARIERVRTSITSGEGRYAVIHLSFELVKNMT
jgi:hypothetical protein